MYNLKELSNTKNPLVIRTYFENNSSWNDILNKINGLYILDFQANVDILDNEQFKDIKPENFIGNKPNKYKHDFIFLVDLLTFSNPENPIICIDLSDELCKSFRVIPSEMWSVENNLSISNMDFDEFYESCDDDGVFRGF